MTPYLPLLGEIPRKRRRHWKRQVLRAHPGLNPDWLDARYQVIFVGGFGNYIEDGNQTRSNQPRLPGPNEAILPFRRQATA